MGRMHVRPVVTSGGLRHPVAAARDTVAPAMVGREDPALITQDDFITDHQNGRMSILAGL